VPREDMFSATAVGMGACSSSCVKMLGELGDNDPAHREEPANAPYHNRLERSPDRGRGLARDMRVRWALEEVGQPYDVRLLFVRCDEGTRPLGASSVRADSDL